MAFKKAINSTIFSEISNYCSNNNIECYVVGGFVRDFILNRECKDVDILIIGDGISAAKKIANTIDANISVTVFRNFGTAYFKYKEYEIEFVGSRKESYVSSSRNPIVQAGTLEDDINRRDFKINSIAISLNKHNFGELVDLHDGLSDINQKIINTPLDSNITFSDDPLRMLRAIRFSCQLDFEIHPELINTMTKLKERISIITSERIIDEINKIILTKTPSEGFKILEKTGLLKLIIPELTNLKGIDEIEGQKHKDNFYHTLEVLDNICLNTNNLWLRWAALLHDIGKAPTKKFNKKIGWTFHGHEFEGSKMVYKIFKRLKLPLNEKLKYIKKLILLSSRPIVLSLENITDSAVRRLIFDAGDDIDDLLTLCEADITTKNEHLQKKYLNNFKIVREKIKIVEERDQIRNFQPPISGEEIMSSFGLKPCKEIGIIKEFIKEAILNGVISNSYDEAKELMYKKAKSLGLKINE